MLRSMVPWTERFPALTAWERELPSLFERLFGAEGWPVMGEGFSPRTNVTETPEAMEVTVELPGMKPEEVNVEIREHELWISGEKKEEREEKGKTFHRVERHYGEFQRVIPLPGHVNTEKVAAEFKDGVLKIAIPKTEQSKPKHVEVVAA